MNIETKEKIKAYVKRAEGGIKMNLETKEKIKDYAKKAVGIFVVAGILAGGGAYFLHTQKVQAKAVDRAARTQLLQKAAEQDNLKLISPEDAKGIAAEYIQADKGTLEFKEVYLDKESYGPKDKSHKDKKHGDKKRDKKQDRRQDRDAVSHATPKSAANAPQQAPAPAVAAPQAGDKVEAQAAPRANEPVMRAPQSKIYVYKVKCLKDKTRYSFEIDAQTGKVLEVRTKTTYF